MFLPFFWRKLEQSYLLLWFSDISISLTGHAVLPCYSTTPIEQSKVIAEFVKNDQMATRGHLFSTTTNKSEIQSKLTIFNLASKQGGIFWPISELFLGVGVTHPSSLKKIGAQFCRCRVTPTILSIKDLNFRSDLLINKVK